MEDNTKIKTAVAFDKYIRRCIVNYRRNVERLAMSMEGGRRPM